jgi:hypothetical protein
MSAKKSTGAWLDSEVQLSIVVLHAGEAAFRSVQEIAGRVLRNLNTSCPVGIQWIAVESLRDRQLFETSRHSAAKADMLFVALDTSSELSSEIKNWLPAVLTGSVSDRRRALVALLETNDALLDWHWMAHRYFQEQAECAGVDYFVHLDRRTAQLL